MKHTLKVVFLAAICSMSTIRTENLNDQRYIKSTIKVAFVFAGSMRTFTLPSIHQSIKYNLIHAFCNPLKCIGDVYIRYSIIDNRHKGFNAQGIAVSGNSTNTQQSVESLQQLKQMSLRSNLVYTSVDVGSSKESQEMDVVTSKHIKQKLYRVLDSRRYSMYFNRWAAYSLMLESEKAYGIRYDWVVHARLDMGWGASIKPCSDWLPTKIYVPDSW